MSKSLSNYLFLLLLLFFLQPNCGLCQDSVKTESKNVTAMTLAVGIPSGLSLFLQQQLFTEFYAEAGVGLLGIIGISYNAGLKYHIGGKNSNQVIGARLTFPINLYDPYMPNKASRLSIWWGYFSLKTSDFPVFFGLGGSLPLTRYIDESPFFFAEIGVRLFSF